VRPVGNSDLAGFLANTTGPVALVLDLRITQGMISRFSLGID